MINRLLGTFWMVMGILHFAYATQNGDIKMLICFALSGIYFCAADILAKLEKIQPKSEEPRY